MTYTIYILLLYLVHMTPCQQMLLADMELHSHTFGAVFMATWHGVILCWLCHFLVLKPIYFQVNSQVQLKYLELYYLEYSTVAQPNSQPEKTSARVCGCAGLCVFPIMSVWTWYVMDLWLETISCCIYPVQFFDTMYYLFCRMFSSLVLQSCLSESL